MGWKCGRKWYKVIVDKVNDDGTYALTYEDGDKWDTVTPDRMRLLDDTPLTNVEVPLEKEKLRHSCIIKAVDPDFLNELFPKILNIFQPQIVKYSNTNPDISSKDGSHGEKIDWKVSSYMEVDQTTPGAMQRNVTCDLNLKSLMMPLLEQCNQLFSSWYEKLHGAGSIKNLVRLQSFVTRYRPFPNENALLRHIDGVHVDGSVILALPTPIPFKGGGVTVWEPKSNKGGQQEQEEESASSSSSSETAFHYPLGCGDMCFVDNAVWHQGNPITHGERWSLVIFYGVKQSNQSRLISIVKKAADEKLKESTAN